MSSGFGQPKQTKKPSKSADVRGKASQQYDKMKADGLPEFNIFLRIKDKKTWYPVGSLAVSRLNKINHAIAQQEAELLQGAFRLFPVLKKHRQFLEYGYQLKQFPDEPIQLAELPQPGKGNFLEHIKNRFSGLLKKS